jgi:hypothetical protein
VERARERERRIDYVYKLWTLKDVKKKNNKMEEQFLWFAWKIPFFRLLLK